MLENSYCEVRRHKYSGMKDAYSQLYKLISDELADIISNRLNVEQLCEVRIRNGAPIAVRYDGAYYYVGKNGITRDIATAITADARDAEQVVLRACEHSLYTVNDTLKRGFISVRGGVRIGVCGSGVTADGKVLAVKDYASVNIRIPHEVKGCASGLFGRVFEHNALQSTLILSPPGAGKTTMLRDLCRLLSERGLCVLLCDEKYELAAAVHGVPTLDVGRNTDVASGMSKRTVFESGIAHMRPDAIIADELFGADADIAAQATTCGISVVATAHARSVDDLKNKREYFDILNSGVFRRFAVLADAPNRTVSVFDGEGRAV